ncbi:hypothetical protein D3C80_1815510 [compost metagenome]
MVQEQTVRSDCNVVFVFISKEPPFAVPVLVLGTLMKITEDFAPPPFSFRRISISVLLFKVNIFPSLTNTAVSVLPVFLKTSSPSTKI